MRKIAIVGAFLAGLVGLFMSVCGGGLLVMTVYDAVFRPGQQKLMLSALMFLLIPSAFFVLGASLFWGCFKFIRRRVGRSREENSEQ
jgi:Na+-transporting NADH:ubiquinone oxidoreductase subunit NqrD